MMARPVHSRRVALPVIASVGQSDDPEAVPGFAVGGLEEGHVAARDGAEVAGHVSRTGPALAAQIGQAARRRVLAEHTYDRRAAAVSRLLGEIALPARPVASLPGSRTAGEG